MITITQHTLQTTPWATYRAERGQSIPDALRSSVALFREHYDRDPEIVLTRAPVPLVDRVEGIVYATRDAMGADQVWLGPAERRPAVDRSLAGLPLFGGRA